MGSRATLKADQDNFYCRRLNNDWVSLVNEIRNVDEFGDFLRPKAFQSLQEAAKSGPMIMLNAVIRSYAPETSCTAIIITVDGVRHVALPDINGAALEGLARSLQFLINSPTKSKINMKSAMDFIL